MSKKIKKSIPWFLILSLVFGLVIGFNFKNLDVKADSADTSVTVANSAPTLASEREDAESTDASPTNSGTDVTFKGTGTDTNGEEYYLAICKDGNITPATNGPPTCDAGNWCISTSTISATEASCTHTTEDADADSKEWWAFACDKHAGAAGLCSAYGQGTGGSGTPFYVNRRPTFTVFADDGPLGPNVAVTWTSTAADADATSTVSLFVCKENDFTGTVCGGGGTWCSSLDDADGDPTCGSTTLRPDGNYTAYGFLIDDHNFAATGGEQGVDSALVVNNVAPTIMESSINLFDVDGSGNLTLTGDELETDNFTVTFIVTDTNSCVTTSSADEITSAFINVRMSEKATGACDASGEYDANDCYPDDYASWNPVCAASSTVDTCSGATDTTVGWACTFPLQYHADPTVGTTPKAAYDWIAAVQATDDDAANSGLVDGTTFRNEMDTFMAYDLNTATIAYGQVGLGGDSVEQTTTVEATGNVGLDENLSGSKLCNDYPGCAGDDDIAILQQNYNLTALQGWGGTGHVALSGTPTEAELDCAKTTITASPATADTYWVLRIPAVQASDVYSGENTIEGKVDNENYGT